MKLEELLLLVSELPWSSDGGCVIDADDFELLISAPWDGTISRDRQAHLDSLNASLASHAVNMLPKLVEALKKAIKTASCLKATYQGGTPQEQMEKEWCTELTAVLNEANHPPA